MIGRTLAHYRITAALGAGGMGEVYRATDTKLGREVALKVLPAAMAASAERLDRFRREAKALATLDHPGIVTVFSVEEADGVHFLTMQLIEGRPLDRILRTEALPVQRVLDIAHAMAVALAAAHEKGIVHRDLKPANVMVTDDGRVKVLDFGLAKELREASPTAATVTSSPRTEAGMVMGTPAYMSPEQAEGRPVDARSDVFSFGAMLYEMLAGRKPFEGESELSLLSSILRDTPPRLRTLRPEVSPRVESLVERCLAKDPAARPASARALVSELEDCLERDRAPSVGRLFRRPAWAAGIALVLVFLGALGLWAWRRSAQEQWARREAIPEIQRLTDRYDPVGAFRLAMRARQYLPDDPELDRLLKNITIAPSSVRTDPEGAEVLAKPYAEPDGEWQRLGTSPLKDLSLPFVPHRFRITKPGFAPLEVAFVPQTMSVLRLIPEADARAGMVFVPPGRSDRADAPIELPAFWLDRYELTNREYDAFVRDGGYRRPELWKHPFVRDGRTIPFEEAMALFRDRTGRLGPATWEQGGFPEGEGDFPVSGISWHEAAAFAEFAGKSLPTLHHWYRAADLGIFSDLLRFSNFGGKGPGRVAERPSLSGFGTYDMAGNVREWSWNASGERRYTLGGAWSDPTYLYTGPDALDPMDRSPILGIRCAVYPEAPPEEAFGPVPRAVPDYSKYRPADDDVFKVYRSSFEYDRGDLAAKVESSEDGPEHWRIEKVSFAAAYGGERIPAYLYLPKHADPPYQTVVYFPASAAVLLRSSEGMRTWDFGFLVKSGRAVLYPIYQGTYERRPTGEAGPNADRDLLIQRTKDVRRALDYLDTRSDVDHERLAFYGLSLGAYYGPLVAAVEGRFRTLVLVSGGAREGLPEVTNLNFAPRVHVPVLMLNGRQDFIFPLDEAQRPLFRLLGTPDADKKHVLFDSGHVPPYDEVVRETLDWLDQRLGPVTR